MPADALTKVVMKSVHRGYPALSSVVWDWYTMQSGHRRCNERNHDVLDLEAVVQLLYSCW